MVTLIFTDFDIEAVLEKLNSNAFYSKLINFIKSNKIAVKLTTLCIISVLAVVISIASVGITLGFEVEYSGKVIATVRNASVFENAKIIALENVNSEGVGKVIKKPELTLTLTVADKLDNANRVANAIIENTCDIVKGSALIINGEVVACTEADGMAELIEARRTAFYVKNAENTAEFVDDVEIEEGYYLACDVDDISVIEETVNNLQVKTVSKISTDISIAFKTKTNKSSAYTVGYNKITTSGKNGITRKTESVESINGSETARTVLSQEVISEPVTQVITMGTAPVKISAADRANISAAGFICPLSKGSYTVSAYYGDGRNHKAIDLAARKGTAIYAAAAGTVTYSGYDGDYGYNIVIDHGNGMKTRYAHASALYISRGTTVAQGDMIAAVGSTGYSTGNHLHFEVIVNGNRVNPAPYIGIN